MEKICTITDNFLPKEQFIALRDAIFQFDLSEVEDKELLSLTIGDTFMGKIATVPLDAYEL